MQKETFTAMTLRRMQMKFHAKRALPGNWLRVMFLVLLSVLASSFCLSYLLQTVDVSVLMSENPTPEAILQALVPQPITRNYLLLVGVSLLLYWFLLSPLSVATARFCIGIACLQKPKLPVAFSVFTDFSLVLRSMGLVLWVGILKLLWGVFFLALPCLVFYAGLLLSSALLLDLAVLVYIAAIVLFVRKTLAYSPALYLFAENPSIGVFGAVRESYAITRGKLTEYLWFELSFIPMRLLVSFAGIFGTLFFTPYYQTATVVLIDYLRTRHDPERYAAAPKEGEE
ncbi:MAG: DUF975 family protein [Ruminococcaceae bacterium]|nr:DUF975 family protein [Oscillospiraceae bacterium]